MSLEKSDKSDDRIRKKAEMMHFFVSMIETTLRHGDRILVRFFLREAVSEGFNTRQLLRMARGQLAAEQELQLQRQEIQARRLSAVKKINTVRPCL